MINSSEVVDRKVITLAGKRVEVRMLKTHFQGRLLPRARFTVEESVCVCGHPLSLHERLETGECALKGCDCIQFIEEGGRS